ARHSEQHEGRLYSIPLEELRAVFPQGLPHRFQQQVQTFNEARLMVRRPALEILACLKGSNFAHPAVRYLIYGERGTGKTMTLCHVVHYCSRQGWLVLHVPDAHLWVKNCKELFQSSYNKARLDQPLQASVWLKNFKTSNERFLEEIKTQKKYIWGRRESTEEGRPLREVVEQVRSKECCWCGLTLCQRSRLLLKVLANRRCLPGGEGVCVSEAAGSAGDAGHPLQVSPEELTLVHSLRKMLSNDWTGGAIVTTLSQTGSLFKPSSAYTPQELLGKEGFDALDPFVPIPVPNYSPKEFESCYSYYLERRWLQHEKARTEDGKAELRFLSGSNPRQLDRLAGPL
ncbi:RT29 protein, partial [Loxia curvirostra]|nr:RT29 protein [Loxia curvirostra]